MVDLIALGPLELWHNGRQHKLGPTQHRRVLAVLLHARGEPVSIETLTARVWEESEPPPGALGTVRTYLSRIRKRLEAVSDEAQLECPSPKQYRLSVPPDSVDLLRFQHLRARARSAVNQDDSDAAICLLREAEALWRGEPLVEFTGEWAASTRARLQEDLLRVKEERIGLELEKGRHADLIGELRELVAQNPFAQRAVGSLMLALYRNGRHAESLDVYQAAYRHFDERLGIRPGSELQNLNRQIIEQDPALELVTIREAEPPVAIGSPSASAPVTDDSRRACDDPRPTGSLPRDTRDFTGRAGELEALLGDSTGTGHEDSTAMPITVLYGMPGIGKTATAVRAAHRMRDRYPDGVYYVDLRGYSEDSRCDPREALATLLRTSGAAAELPDSLDERAARWREWTARHRALVILDNAHATQQVTHLLPGAPTCRVIVTSRVRLAGLVDGQPLFLDALSVNEAMELFTRVAGTARTHDRVALRRVVDACGRHPLALQLLAGRFRHRESWDMEHLHERLTQAPNPLEEFDTGLSQSIQLSYAELGSRAQQVLRRLALHPGPDITLGGVRALLGTDAPDARQGVEELQDAHLLNETVRGRFQPHDLIRAFSIQVSRRDEPEPARHSAIHRLITYYLRSADRADRLAHPQRRRLPVEGPQQETPVDAEKFATADEASVWLEIERANLLAVARTAMTSVPSLVAPIAHVLAPSLRLWGTYRLAAELHSRAVTVLRSSSDRLALALALTDRAGVRAQECPNDALGDASEALALFESLSDEEGTAAALLQLGRGQLASGHGRKALQTLAPALRLHEVAGDRYGQAEVLNVQGVALHYQGDHAAAFDCFHAMLVLAEELGDLHLESKALNNMGDLSLLEERYEEAREYFERSLVLAKRFGGQRDRVILDSNLAAVYKATGEPERALASLQRALDHYRSGGDTSGEADTLIALGETFADMGRHREALLHFSRAEEVAVRIDNAYEKSRALVGKAAIHRKSGHIDSANQSYQQALHISRRIDFPLGAAHALDGLARGSALTGSEISALNYGEEALALYDRLGAEAEAASLRRFLGSLKATGS